jgi:hypothetical protein
MLDIHHGIVVDTGDDQFLELISSEHPRGVDKWQIPDLLWTAVMDSDGETVVAPLDISGGRHLVPLD